MYLKKFLFFTLFLSVTFGSVPDRTVTAPQNEFTTLLKLAPSISPNALQAALLSLSRLQAAGKPVRHDVLAIIDYTSPRQNRASGSLIWFTTVFFFTS